MKFPSLVLPEFCNTPISVYFESEEVNKYGEPTIFEWSGFCNYQDSCKQVIQDNNRVIQLKGKIYIIGDIAPDLADIAGGEVEIMGIKRTIFNSVKNRNLDGTVNFTTLEVM